MDIIRLVIEEIVRLSGLPDLKICTSRDYIYVDVLFDAKRFCLLSLSAKSENATIYVYYKLGSFVYYNKYFLADPKCFEKAANRMKEVVKTMPAPNVMIPLRLGWS